MRKIITAFMMLLCAVCMASAANYLTFTAEEDGSSFGIDYNYLEPDVQYSLDGGETWSELMVGDTILLPQKGDKALIRGYNENGLGSNGKQFVHFVMTGAIAASGSVMSLIDGIGLSTEIPNEDCFRSLFYYCTSLTQAPELPATTLADYCYQDMFYHCTSLTKAPELPAATLAGRCYVGMFEGCSSLTQAPVLPAVTLAEGCYASMFYRCTSLTQAPELPAATLAGGCYSEMFSGCTSLTQAPELPATTLAYQCYYKMFEDCTSLSEIHVSFDDWSDVKYPTTRWVENVAPTGTFICPKALALEYGVNRIPEGWTVKYLVDTIVVKPNYLTFTAEEDSSTFRIINERGNNPNVQYSLDGGVTWTALAAGDIITLAHKGDRALLKGKNLEGFSNGSSKYSSFTMTGKIAASGSVMSLIDGAGVSTTIPNTYCFNNLFAGCTSLTQAPELPATKLDGYCYASMFSGCTGLTQAPELPATKLVWYCYNSMFKGCTSLTKAPKLSVAEIEGKYCYGEMFYGCTSLSQIDVAFEEWPINDGTYNWVKNVAPTGLFICSKTLPLECGVNRIPEGWTLKFIDDITPDSANYLTFTAEEDSSKVGIVDNYKNFDVLYSLDGGETWNALTEEYSVTLAHKGDKALIRGYNPNGFNFVSRCRKFTMTGKIAANGSVMSLIDGVGNTTVIPSGYCFFRLFYRCSSLTQAPELPATTLTNICYEEMFEGCTNLTKAPELPATTLAESCYASMFSGCANLTQAPELPATTLAEYCYASMFSECTNLKEASELPATTLAEACYEGLFSGCTNLTQAPELPATTLAEWCYSYMFNGCTNLTQAPKLPAITLNYWCYYEMFDGCTNLMQAPELPATTLAEQCYSLMFYGCTSLSQIHVSFDNWNDANYPTSNWVEDVAPTGTFICPKALAEEYGESRIPEGWTVKYIDDTVAVEANYLTFTAEEDGSSFGIVTNAGNNPDVQYSLDGGETWTALTQGDSVVLAHKGDKALLRGNNPEGFSKSRSQYSTFEMTGKVSASGSVMSLIDGTGLSTEIPNGYCFCRSFRSCTSLTRAPELPATTLTAFCYDAMFSGCASLTEAPELPATTLAECCYWEMFSGCTSLTQAPELPATTLAGDCYYYMFSDCKSLTQAPELPATKLAEVCYSGMFRGCTSLTQAPELPATTLAVACYDGMFWGCTSLTQAPELPATTLADDCYQYMFWGCTSLTQAPELPATTLADNCYQYMFKGCTSLTQAPELPALELPADPDPKCVCYGEMFSGCTNLSEIRVAFVEWKNSTDQGNNTYRWVENVAPTGTFYCPKALPLEYGESRIPEGWTVKYIEDVSVKSVTLADNITVWSDGLTVYVRGAEGEVSLYDMSGKRVAVSSSADGERALSVPAKGVYVVRTNNGTSDVLVR